MREYYGFGLAAGLTYTEMRRLSPGFILDVYCYKRDYDDEQHGITRGEAEQ